VVGREWSIAVMALTCALTLVACKRETRAYREAAPTSPPEGVTVSDLRPGGGEAPPRTITPYEQNAWALNEGKRLFTAYNCSGCHANGGGGMGPALIDDEWTYGHEADQVFQTILEGRPNGMPAFRGRIPDTQIWQLAAYIRSMGGLAPKDAAPSRSDHMSANPPENATPRRMPKNAGDPAAAIR
jgi:cytochrome c oxidase cbb3-type subunit 3